MRFAVVGAGALGGYFGGRLARAGEDVTFIARGAHRDALIERGLEVHSVHGDLRVDVRATDDPASVGPVDVLLFLVKTYDTEAAAMDARPLVGERTAILSLQNGVDNAERIRAIVGRGHPLGGLAYTEAALEAPGVVAQYSQMQRVVIGELGGRISPLVERVVAAFRDAGVDASASATIVRELWAKWIFISSFGGVLTLCRMPIGPVIATAEGRELLVAAVREVEAVARRKAIGLDSEIVPRTMRMIEGFHAEMKPSLLRDAERGRPLEIEALSGRVTEFGRASGVPTPVHEVIYRALMPMHRAALKARQPDQLPLSQPIVK